MRSKFVWILGIALAWCLLVPGVSFAQSGIAGVVKDTSGAVLPGVTVEVSSPVLIEQTRSAVTDGSGAYRILDLRPGTYAVVFTLPGFATVRREGLALPDAFTATVNADMRVGALEETITVTGESPIVDVQNVTQRTVLNDALVDSLPTIRFVHTYATLLPAVTGTTFSSNGTDQRKYWAHGGKQADSVVSIDGFSTNFGMPGFGGNSSYFMNSAYVQEVSMIVSAGSPEVGFGGVMSNVIPKEGGNDLSYYFYANYTDENMSWNNVDQFLIDHWGGKVSKDQGAHTIKQWDAVPAVGGPIVRDKLWFFTSGENSTVNRSRPGVYYNATQFGWVYTPDKDRPAGNKNSDTDKGLRLTWQASPRNKISAFWSQQIHTYHQRNADESATSSTTSAPESTNFTEEWPNYVSQLVWKSPLSSKVFLEAGFSINATAIPTQPSRDPGYGSVDPFSLIAVTDQDSGYCSRVSGGTGCGGWNMPWNRYSYQRASLAYITGSHAYKVGWQGRYGDVGSHGNPGQPMSFRMRSGVPNQLTQTQGMRERQEKGIESSFYAQDQWTSGKFTINYGGRFDHQREWVPATSNAATLFVPATSFDKVEDVPNYWDFSPRFGFAYDLKGDGRTALKFTVNRYVGQSLGGISGDMNPTSRIVGSVNRNWTDNNKDYWPNCDLNNPKAQSPATTGSVDSCGSISNTNFGQANPTDLGYDPDLLTGWGKRIHNWETSVQIDQQVTGNLGFSVAYFRRVQGGLTTTDNLNLTPADYDQFCVTAPSNSYLPDGGGYQICDLTNISVEGRDRPVADMVVAAPDFKENWQGVDTQMQMRLPGDASVSGGFSTGRTYTDSCASPDLPVVQYCETKGSFQTSVKFIGRYVLPWQDIELSGTYANVPGAYWQASRVYTNAEILPSLHRNLSSGANGNVTVNLIPPSSINMDRKTQVDFKIAKTLRRNKLRVTPSVDFTNLFNANGIEAYNIVLNDLYPRPVRTQFGRFAKFTILMTY